MIWKYMLAWFGLMILAVINGAFREFTYKMAAGELAANQISTVILILLISGYLWFLVRRWPIRSPKDAWLIGIAWFVMTEVFEFGFGLNRGMSWAEMLDTYNIPDGQLWLLIPLWVLIAPYVFHRFVQPKPASK